MFKLLPSDKVIQKKESLFRMLPGNKNQQGTVQTKKSFYLLDDKNSPVVQKKQTFLLLPQKSAAVQTALDRQELWTFFDRELGGVGSVTSRASRTAFADAFNTAINQQDAKQKLREYVRNKKRFIERESRDDDGPSIRNPVSTALSLTSRDISNIVGPYTATDLGVTPSNQKYINYRDFKKLNKVDRMRLVAEIAASFGATEYELYLRHNVEKMRHNGVLNMIDFIADQAKTNRSILEDLAAGNPLLTMNGQIGIFFRYHKFAEDPVSQEMVFGGGFNKNNITPEFQGKGLASYFNVRHKALAAISMGKSKSSQLQQIQKFQASAMNTPFIATTIDYKYTRQLFNEYPPTQRQKAAILIIIGPRVNAFDFEERVRVMDRGFRIFNGRTNIKRAKDSDQAEFGLSDIFIPIDGRSPYGFRVAGIEWLT